MVLKKRHLVLFIHIAFLPHYLIGHYFRLPNGESRLFVSQSKDHSSHISEEIGNISAESIDTYEEDRDHSSEDIPRYRDERNHFFELEQMEGKERKESLGDIDNGTELIRLIIKNDWPNFYSLCKRSSTEVFTASYPFSLLHYAAKYCKSADPILFLLGKGARINGRDVHGRTPLLEAASSGNTVSAKVLIDAGADVNAQTEDGSTALHSAAHGGSAKIVKSLLVFNDRVNLQNKDGRTPLFLAIQGRNLEVVKLLLKAQAQVNIQDNEGNIPLHFVPHVWDMGLDITMIATLIKAKSNFSQPNHRGLTPLHEEFKRISNENIDIIVKNLPANKTLGVPNIDFQDELGNSLLHEAVKSGNMRFILKLLNSKANNKLRNKYGFTPLHYAAQKMYSFPPHTIDYAVMSALPRTAAKTKAVYDKENLLILTMLAQNTVDIPNNKGETALLVACMSKNDDTFFVSFLLKAGAIIESEDDLGNRPLHYAAEKGHRKIVKKLVRSNANVNSKGKNGRTPLHSAVLNDKKKIVAMLLEAGADVNSYDEYGFTPLYCAVLKNNKTITRSLIEAGADIEWRVKTGITPLRKACELGYLEVVKVLLENDVQVDSQGDKGFSAVHWAARRGYKEILEALAMKHANLNIQTRNGRTPLSESVRYKKVHCVKYLINSGVDIAIRDKYGYSALDIACKKGLVGSVRLLLKAGASPQSKTKNGPDPLGLARANKRPKCEKLLLSKIAELRDRSLLDEANGGVDSALTSHIDEDSQLFPPTIDDNDSSQVAWQNRDSGDHALLSSSESLEKDGLDSSTEEFDLNNPSTERSEDRVNIASLEDGGRALVEKAFNEGNSKLLTTLLRSGFALDQKNEDGSTLLHRAAMRETDEMTRILVGAGVSVDSLDGTGRTPLHLAALHNRIENAQTLLDAGANLNMQDGEGKTALYIGAEAGYSALVMLLLSQKAEVDTRAKNQRTALYGAVLGNHPEIVRILLRSKADPNLHDSYGLTPLHWACINSLIEIIQLFIDAKVQIDFPSPRGHTPLNLVLATSFSLSHPYSQSLLQGNEDLHIKDKSGVRDLSRILELLIRAGADVNRGDTAGNTPLYNAARLENPEIVTQLLQANADSKTQTRLSKKTPLMAAWNNCIPAVGEALIKFGADPNVQSKTGRTALHYYFLRKHLRTISPEDFLTILLEAGADVNRVDKNGDTPFTLAIMFQDIAGIREMLKKGAPVNIQARYGNTALHVAVANAHMRLKNFDSENGDRREVEIFDVDVPPNLDMVKWLLSLQANPNLSNKAGNFPIHSAFKYDLLKTLLNAQADPNSLDAEKKNCLSLAVLRRRDTYGNLKHEEADKAYCEENLNIIKLLLDAGTLIEVPDIFGKTSFHYAAEIGDSEVVALFKDRGASVDDQTKIEGNSALHIACKKRGNDERILGLLLDLGASPFLKNNQGLTPSDLAPSYFPQCRELIEAKIAKMRQNLKNNQISLVSAAAGGDETAVLLLSKDPEELNTRDADNNTALHKAVTSGAEGCLRALLETELPINALNIHGETALCRAINTQNDVAAELLLKSGAVLSCPAFDGSSALHKASQNGLQETVGLISQRNPELVDLRDEYNRTPLHAALMSGHSGQKVAGIVKLLLNAGADQSCQDSEGMTALYYAAKSNQLASVEALVEQMAPVNARTTKGRSPLHVAAQLDNSDIVTLLIRKGSDYNMADDQGLTPLHCAAQHNASLATVTLISEGAKIDSEDHKGMTPLFSAAQKGSEAVCQKLLDAGANIGHKTQNNESVVHILATGSSPSCIDFCLEKVRKNGIDLISQDIRGWAPVHVAAAATNVHLIKSLKASNAIDEVTEDGLTPLMIASKEGDPQVMDEVYDMAHMNKSDSYKRNALHFAAISQKPQNMAWLLGKSKSELDAEDALKQTPLMRSATCGNREITKMLLHEKADIYKTDRSGRTALHRAFASGAYEISKDILEQVAPHDRSRYCNLRDSNGQSTIFFLIELQRSSSKITLEIQKSLIDLFCEYGGDITQNDGHGKNVLYYALKKGRFDVARYFVEKGVSVDRYLGEGQRQVRLIHLAAAAEISSSPFQDIDFLVEHNADLLIVDSVGRGPLYYAVEANRADLCYYLFKKGAKFSLTKDVGDLQKNLQTNSPFLLAAMQGNISLLQVLVGYGCQEFFNSVKVFDQEVILQKIKTIFGIYIDFLEKWGYATDCLKSDMIETYFKDFICQDYNMKIEKPYLEYVSDKIFNINFFQ